MKEILDSDVYPLLFKAEAIFRSEFKGKSISESDEIKEQLTAMRLFMSELIDKIKKGESFDVEFVGAKLEIIEEYLEELSDISVDSEAQEESATPYGAYSIHEQ